jgi:hypothetical protein
LRQDPPGNDFRGGRKRDILLLQELFGDQQKERLHVVVVDLFFECLPERDPEYILQGGGRGRKTDIEDGNSPFYIHRQTEIQKMSAGEAEKRHLLGICGFGNRQKKRHEHAIDAFFYVDDVCVLLLALWEHPPCVAEPEFVVKRASDQTALVKEGCSLKVSLSFLEINMPVPFIELDDIKLRYMEVRASLADWDPETILGGRRRRDILRVWYIFGGQQQKRYSRLCSLFCRLAEEETWTEYARSFRRTAEEEIFDGFRIFERSTSISSVVHSESGAERFLRRGKKGDIFTDRFCLWISGARQSRDSEIYQGGQRKRHECHHLLFEAGLRHAVLEYAFLSATDQKMPPGEARERDISQSLFVRDPAKERHRDSSLEGPQKEIYSVWFRCWDRASSCSRYHLFKHAQPTRQFVFNRRIEKDIGEKMKNFPQLAEASRVRQSVF